MAAISADDYFLRSRRVIDFLVYYIYYTFIYLPRAMLQTLACLLDWGLIKVSIFCMTCVVWPKLLKIQVLAIFQMHKLLYALYWFLLLTLLLKRKVKFGSSETSNLFFIRMLVDGPTLCDLIIDTLRLYTYSGIIPRFNSPLCFI